jgi:hypothetical protein
LTRRRPFISNQGTPQIFAIQVETNSEANEVLSLLPLLMQRHENESKRDLAEWLVTSKDVGGVLRDVDQFYPIATGNFAGIYRTWYVMSFLKVRADVIE